MSCGKTFLYLQKKSLDKHLFAFVPSRCKSWSCPKCRPIKSKIVKNYILENFTGDNLYLLSLTYFHSGTVLDTWKSLGASWNRLRTYVTKQVGKFDYIRIVEPHKKGGWPHIHVLIKGSVISGNILKRITDWGFGWSAHVTRISSESAAFYISKYLSKEWVSVNADVLRVASKSRIVSASRALPPIFTSKGEWDVVQHSAPEGHANFMCNAIISLLKSKGCSYVLSKPFADGFIIESDISIDRNWLDHFFDPYIWEHCDDYRYSYLPFGIQEILIL